MVRCVGGAAPHHPEKTKVKLGAEGGRDLVLHGQTVIIVLCQIVLFLTKIFTNFAKRDNFIFARANLGCIVCVKPSSTFTLWYLL